MLQKIVCKFGNKERVDDYFVRNYEDYMRHNIRLHEA